MWWLKVSWGKNFFLFDSWLTTVGGNQMIEGTFD